MSGIQVAQGQERFIKPISNFTQDQCENKLEYVTGQNTNGQKRAMDSVIYGLAPISTANVIAAGSTKRVIIKVAHAARKNDVIQFTSGSSDGVSIQILSCPDADTMILAATSEFPIAVGDTFDIKRYVTPQYDEDGALVVIATPGPIQYNLDGVAVEVNRDTTVAANTRPLPVEIMGADGVVFNITAGDIDIHTTDIGANFDAMRIGDGSGGYAGIKGGDELMTSDADALIALNSIDGKTPALGQAAKAASVPVTLASDQGILLTETEGTLSTVNSTSVNLAGGATFTGTGEDVKNFGVITIGIVASHDSAASGLVFESSPDNVTWYTSDTYTYLTVNGLTIYSISPVLRYFRLRYVNGATLTTYLHIQTTYRTNYTKPSSHRLDDLVNAENDAELVKAILAAKKPDGTWVNIAATAGGNLKVSVEEFDTELPAGTNTIGAVNQGTAGVSSWLVDVTSSVLPTGAATSANQTSDIAQNLSLIGALTETAPGTDTASSGLNGRLQRIAQRLTSLIALFPTSIGQKNSAGSLSVVLASDQGTITSADAVQVGTYAQSLVVADSGVTTLTPPANAKSAKVMTGDGNSVNLKITLDGSTPSATVGMSMQPGRSEDFTGVTSLKAIAASTATAQEIYVHWSV